LPETFIFAASSEMERKIWMLNLWKCLRDIYYEQHPDTLMAHSHKRKQIRNRLYAPMQPSWSWAYFQDRLLFPWKYRPEGKIEEEENVQTWIKYNHKVLMMFYVPPKGMPRSTRILLFLLDFLLNLFLTLLMEGEPQQNFLQGLNNPRS